MGLIVAIESIAPIESIPQIARIESIAPIQSIESIARDIHHKTPRLRGAFRSPALLHRAGRTGYLQHPHRQNHRRFLELYARDG